MSRNLPTALEVLGPGVIEQAEVEAGKFANIPTAALVGLVGSIGHTIVREGCAAELQRRHAQRLAEFSESSGQQTDRVIALTKQLRSLTVVITWLTVAAVVLGGIQATAVLVHFYRWYRGWL
jgi:hypothetical protein